MLTLMLSFGTESWPIKKLKMKGEYKRLKRTLRTIPGKGRRDTVRNDRIKRMMGTLPMERNIEATQLRWFGNLERIVEGRAAKTGWLWIPCDTRARRRPRRRWWDGVEEIISKHNLPSLQELREARVLGHSLEWWRRRLAPVAGWRPTWDLK